MHKHKKPSSKQLELFWKLVNSRKVSSANFQKYLDDPNCVFGPTELQQLIRSCGFVNVHRDITAENFPTEDYPSRETDAHVMHFGELLSTHELIDRMDVVGVEPASLRDLLYWCMEDSKNGYDYPTYALGSVWEGDCPYVWPDDGGRGLDTTCVNKSSWRSHCRFLVRRKKTVEQGADELQQLIDACKFVWVNKDIDTEKFPLEDDQPDYEYDLEVAHWNCEMGANAVLARIEEHGCEPASLRDMLRYCAEHTKEGFKYQLVALGSVHTYAVDHMYCAQVWNDGSGRNLSLGHSSLIWNNLTRFLVRRRKSRLLLD